jgi:secreted PhoX family phosphatase
MITLLRPRLAIVLVLTLAGCVHHHSSSPSTPSTASPGSSITQALWIANGTSVVEFLPSQLTAGGDPQPHLIDASSVFGSAQGVAFDASGDLWVIDSGTLLEQGTARPSLYEFTPTQLAELASNEAPLPVKTIDYAGFIFPQQLTFDAGGDLWISDSGSNTVYEYTASQLTLDTFNATPNVQFKASPPFAAALGIAFTSAGNLWVANTSSTTIDEFNATALPTAFGSISTLSPNVVLRNSGESIDGPWALAFDGSGNLWVSNVNSDDAIVKFPASTLAAGGSPSPLVITSASYNGNPTLVEPNGIAFDNRGDLAVISAGSPFGIALFSEAQLASGGATVPHFFLVGPNTTLVAPAGAAFGPIVN